MKNCETSPCRGGSIGQAQKHMCGSTLSHLHGECYEELSILLIKQGSVLI